MSTLLMAPLSTRLVQKLADTPSGDLREVVQEEVLLLSQQIYVMRTCSDYLFPSPSLMFYEG